jgi:hypothetical protein
MYNIISINIGPILEFDKRARFLRLGPASCEADARAKISKSISHLVRESFGSDEAHLTSHEQIKAKS